MQILMLNLGEDGDYDYGVRVTLHSVSASLEEIAKETALDMAVPNVETMADLMEALRIEHGEDVSYSLQRAQIDFCVACGSREEMSEGDPYNLCGKCYGLIHCDPPVG